MVYGVEHFPGGVIRYRVCRECGHRVRSVEQVVCAVGVYKPHRTEKTA